MCTATVAWLLHQEKATVEQSSYEFSPGICPKECGRGPLVEDPLVDDTKIELLCHRTKQCLASHHTLHITADGPSSLSGMGSGPWEACRGREENEHGTKYCQILDNPTQSASELRLWRRCLFPVRQ